MSVSAEWIMAVCALVGMVLTLGAVVYNWATQAAMIGELTRRLDTQGKEIGELRAEAKEFAPHDTLDATEGRIMTAIATSQSVVLGQIDALSRRVDALALRH